MASRVNISVVLVLVCTLAYVSADHERGHTENPKCCREPLQRSGSCCKLTPKLLPEAVVLACIASVPRPPGGPQKQQNVGGRRPPSGGHGGHGPKGPGPCVPDCIFKNQSLYNADGSINVDQVTTVFTASSANASATWAPVLQAAIANCSAAVAGMNVSGMPPPPSGAPVCNFTAAMFMRCTNRYLLLNCPSDIASTDTSCPSIVASLQACDPLSMPPRNQKGPGSSEEAGAGQNSGSPKSGKLQKERQSNKKSNQNQRG